jgi:rSAM/selenodomain-associated transferase 1
VNRVPLSASAPPPAACLLLFTKPARPGRVKTRLVGTLSAEQAAALHQAFLGDLCERLAAQRGFGLRLAWAVEEGEAPPAAPLPAVVQRGGDLGERLFAALAEAAAEHPFVGAVGSDHPALSAERVEEAFAALAAGADVALGPAHDGGYYLIALRREALSPQLFAGVPWSTGEVLAHTLARCAELGLATVLLPAEADVDTPADLARLAAALLDARTPSCPRTRALLSEWGMLAAGLVVQEPAVALL